MLNRRQVGTAAASLLAATAVPRALAEGKPTPLPIEAFFQHPSLTEALLSPSGKSVALRIGSKDDRLRLVVLDLTTMKLTVVAAFTDVDIYQFHWINDQRLVFNVSDNRSAPADQYLAQGLFAVNADGERFRQLVARFRSFVKDPIASRELPWNHFLLQASGSQTTDEVFVISPQEMTGKSADFYKLLRLNTLTNRATEVDAPLHAFNWLIDRNDQLRAVMTRLDDKAALHVRDDASGVWRKVREFDAFFGSEVSLRWVGPDGLIYVTARPGRDTEAVYIYDPKTDSLADKPIMGTPQYDLNPDFIATDEKLLGLRFTVDATVTQWLDEGMKAHQAVVDKLLPVTANLLTPPRRGTALFMVVHSFSDRQPGLYHLYNTQTQKLTRLGTTQPEIKPAQMGTMDMLRYKARDGLEIPAYLTLPPGGANKNLPLIVYVHGGPFMRGTSWGWHREVQFLVSRGYAVLQPEFRGSTGFGDKLFKAGWKQWGLAMQNDLADGARWAIDSGLADPKRIAIMGASYGGYAAMMGLVNDPDLFRCGVEWVGVSDLLLYYDAGWSDFSDEWKRYGAPKILGDRERDAAQLKATSPLYNAERIKNPLLMAAGRIDRRVPIEHGRRMYDAIKGRNPNVEWVEYDKDGHGWALPETQIDFWRRVEAFLARYLA